MRRRFSSYKGSFDYSDYMTIEALVDGVTVIMPRDVEYNMGKGWVAIASGVSTPILNKGQYISFRGYLLSGSFGTIQISGNCSLRGNCMSLIGKSSLHSFVFSHLFVGCPIIEVESSFLPATTLAYSCYDSMFSLCKALTTAPELPATILKNYNYCYKNMFSGCTSLTTAPKLPATTLAGECYSSMFHGCSSLVSAPELPATTLLSGCYASMFRNCTSLTTAPKLPATKLARDCYSNMFDGCTSLITAPALPATTLYEDCYNSMFYGTNVLPDCSNIDVSNNTIVSRGGLRGLFAGTKVTDADLFNVLPTNQATGKYWLPATTLASSCYDSMFRGCSGLVTAPELPATILAEGCYDSMFRGCSKLNYIKMLATDISASSCLYNWVRDVSSTGTFVKNTAMTSLPTAASYNDYRGIPSKWTIYNDGEEPEGVGKFYVSIEEAIGHPLFLTFTIDSPKTWNECIGLKDDTGVYEITYEMIAPEVYRFLISSVDELLAEYYSIEVDEDGNTPTPEDLIKIGTTYIAFYF